MNESFKDDPSLVCVCACVCVCVLACVRAGVCVLVCVREEDTQPRLVQTHSSFITVSVMWLCSTLGLELIEDQQ